MLKRLLSTLIIVWLVVVFIAVFVYIFRNYETILSLLRAIPFERVVLSLSLILIGRLLIAHLARIASSTIGWMVTYREMLYIFGTSELGKYIPGNVWHFVGRAAYYRAANLAASNVTRSLVFEHLSLMVSALFAGSSLLMLYTTGFVLNTYLSVAIILLIWICILWIMLRQQESSKLLAIAQLFFLQCGIWLVYSLSFICILPDMTFQNGTLLALGAFPIGWLVGFVTPFAPGGVGTREIVLVALLLPILSAETALVFVTFHRLLWVILDPVLGLFVVIWRRASA